MENESKLKQFFSNLADQIAEQEAFQQLKGKWEELDPTSRQYLKIGGLVGSALLVVVLVISSVWSVHSLKRELGEKQQLLGTIQTANDELRRLRDATAGLPSADASQNGPWQPYFESIAGGAGIDRSAMVVSEEKPGASGDTSKESLFDVNVKHVNIKQVVRYAFGLENGSRPVKLRGLTIDAKPDAEGYMDATLAVSAFAMVSK